MGKDYETGLDRDERYLLNKLRSDMIEKLESPRKHRCKDCYVSEVKLDERYCQNCLKLHPNFSKRNLPST